MRLVMIGTGPFAMPAFRGLYDTHHEIVALVTKPLDPHRGRAAASIPPIRDIANAQGTPIFGPVDINSEQAHIQLEQFCADLLVVCDYGQILSAATLATSRLGGVNIHGSLLPKYRGAAPINWAIYHGDAETGVSVIHMTPRVDAGPVMAQGRLDIHPEETAVELEIRLSEVGAWLVRRAIDSLEAGRWEALPQDPKLASKAPRLKKTDGLIDWTRLASAIKNQVRAMEPWPKTYTFWHRRKAEPLRLVLGPVSIENLADSPAPPGTIVEASGDRLLVAAGQGAVRLQRLQPAGKRMLAVAEFLRGYRVQPGDTFAGPTSGPSENKLDISTGRKTAQPPFDPY
ncbi:MAG: methionyl-tRNA formyltransferase [Pirellulales bacterium]|nr:methionyl-tRNA formyltransferase [Pirellulales bacterium]